MRRISTNFEHASRARRAVARFMSAPGGKNERASRARRAVARFMSAPGGKNERASRARRAGEQGFHASDSTDAPRPARHAAASYAAISTMWEALCGRLAQRHPVSRPQRALRDARRGYNISRYLGIKGKINAPCARDGMLPIFASGSPVQRALRACATDSARRSHLRLSAGRLYARSPSVGVANRPDGSCHRHGGVGRISTPPWSDDQCALKRIDNGAHPCAFALGRRALCRALSFPTGRGCAPDFTFSRCSLPANLLCCKHIYCKEGWIWRS